MAHFAELNASNEVIRILVVNNDVIKDSDGVEQESIGIAFLKSLTGDDTTIWKQTSFNGNFRARYAFIDAGDGLGPGTYDSVRDAFIQPKPYASWALDSNHAWQAPITYPTVTTYNDTATDNTPDGVFEYFIQWDESAYQADNTKGWTAIARIDDADINYTWNTTTSAWDTV